MDIVLNLMQFRSALQAGGLGGAHKAVVFGMLERGGELRAHKVPDRKANTL